MSDGRIRWTMSLRKRDDKLIEYFSDVEDGDRSAECRKLMYLGLEMLEKNSEPPVPEVPRTTVRPFPRKESGNDQIAELNERLDKLI